MKKRILKNASMLLFSGLICQSAYSQFSVVDTTNDDWVNSGNNIIMGSPGVTGNVGIGVASPQSKLDVDGDINLPDDNYIRFDNLPVIHVNTGSNGSVSIGRNSGNVLPGSGYNNNVFVGYNAGQSNTNSYGTFIGFGAGQNNGGIGNSFIGSNSGVSNSTGIVNTFTGYNSGNANTDGDYNAFFGGSSGFSNTSGNQNTFVGVGAGYLNEEGNENVMIGRNAGRTSTSDGNVVIGCEAGKFYTGEYSVLIGYRSGWSTDGATNNSGTQNVFLGNNSGYKKRVFRKVCH